MKSFQFTFIPCGNKIGSLSKCFKFEQELHNSGGQYNLYMIGHLRQSLPQDENFLSDLAATIKSSQAKSKFKSFEKVLNSSLQAANEFLDQMQKQGNVSWMGNLDFAIFALREREFLFSKTGDISILLMRQGTFINLNEDLKNIEPPSLQTRVFDNLVCGKLESGDAIFAATPQIAKIANKEKINSEIAALINPENVAFSVQTLEKIFSLRKDKFKETCGCCVLISLRDDLPESLCRSLGGGSSENLPASGKIMPKIFITGNDKIPEFFKKRGRKIPIKKAAVALAAVLATVFGANWLYSAYLDKKTGDYKNELKNISVKIDAAVLGGPENRQNAAQILDEAMRDLNAIKISSGGLSGRIMPEINALESSIKESFLEINGVTSVQPELVLQFNEAMPKNIVAAGENIIAFGNGGKKILVINNGQPRVLKTGDNFLIAAAQDSAAVLFAAPDTVTEFKNNELGDTVRLGLPRSGVDFYAMAAYSGNLYFIDRETQNIIKYPKQGNKYGASLNWLQGNNEKISGAVSIAVERNVWILNGNGSIAKYFSGKLLETYEPKYFPPLENPVKLAVSQNAENIFILDSGSGRIIILSNNGQIIKQLASGSLKGALDFAIDSAGKKALVLSQNQLLSLNLPD